jgi:hypothetical protein
LESEAQQKAIKQYLLGELSQGELASLEERLLTDEAFYEELLIAEDELVDQHLRGDLSASESEHFEAHFLRTADRRRKLNFATALKKYLALEVVSPAPAVATAGDLPVGYLEVPKPPPKWRLFSLLNIQNPILGFSLAAVVLLSLFGAAWWIIRSGSQPEQHDILTEVLTPGQVRSDDASVKTFSIPARNYTVRLQLELIADDYQLYRATLQNAAGTVLLLQKDLKAQAIGGRSSVVVEVPAEQLPPSYYLIKLTGITAARNEENLGSYSFKVSR